MKEVDRYIAITEAKTRLLNLVRDLQARDDIIAVTKNGIPAAVLVSVTKFEELLETIDILSDEGAMRSLRRSLREAQAGRWLGHEEIFRKQREPTGPPRMSRMTANAGWPFK